MDFAKFGSKYIVRLDKGEEIVSMLKDFCSKNSIKLGTVYGLGSTNAITIGLFNTHEKKYYSKEFKGDFEILNLTGNISTMNEDTYLHLHVSISDSDLRSYGGHLNSAIVSGTAEIIVESIEGTVDRKFDSEIGLNLYNFKR
ncbi:DNA-binding protein [Petrotoga sp. HWH.PT.55.6.1]|jgi:hypothetical protein|uniref:PPC domain-containing DNA-binding protein n=1 Tax=unclassified Petrotoga TaxID=2620614 RepID=UPI000CA0332E|nr:MULTISPECIES: PPC domain-containing DNA-binding protein [unclassified Petrotoga]MDK2906553.1 uncharacterized protein [Petrotoga sp.]PNR93764.1 hypothetical protein X926_02030 [Petrotoga sp. HWHPT.55.6.3]RPD36489.1 DNA-binding protein [Petrotoga sp. HWH.PT.55.6.1]